MNTAFGLGIAIGILALYQQGSRLNASLITRLIVDHLDLISALFGPAIIHALKHFGPILALGSASAGMNFNKSVVAIGFAGKQSCNLVAIGTVGQRF